MAGNKRRSRIVAVFVFLLLAAYCSLSVGLGEPANNILFRLNREKTLLAELGSEQEKWDSLEITHYSVHVENVNFTSYALICKSADLEVKDNNLYKFSGEGAEASACRYVYDQLTVDSLFTIARKYLAPYDPIRLRKLGIVYDDKYGFVSQIDVVVQPTGFDPFLFQGESFQLESTSFIVRLSEFQKLSDN